MSSTEFLILVFGIIFLLYFMSNTEAFGLTDSLGLQTSILPIDDNHGMTQAPIDNQQLVNKMEKVLAQEKIIRKQAVDDFQREGLKSANIVNYYNTPRNIPYDIKRHDYKFEKNPQDVINEMTKKGESLELRKVFNKIVKDYSQVNPQNINNPELKEDANKMISVDQNEFSYLDETKIPKLDDIQPLDSIQSSFCKWTK